MGGTPVRTKNFEWTTNLTYAANRSEVLALNEGVDEMILGGAGMPGFSDAVRLEVGQPIGLVKVSGMTEYGKAMRRFWQVRMESLPALRNISTRIITE